MPVRLFRGGGGQRRSLSNIKAVGDRLEDNRRRGDPAARWKPFQSSSLTYPRDLYEEETEVPADKFML